MEEGPDIRKKDEQRKRDKRNRQERQERQGGGDGEGRPQEIQHPRPPFGAASVSLLIELLVRKARAAEWAVERQRAHARAILEVVDEYHLTDDERSLLSSIAAIDEA
jgi:hypothetical protein